MASKKWKKGPSLADADRDYVTSKGFSEGPLYETLQRLGLNERVDALRSRIDDMDVRQSIDTAQEYLSEQIDAARDYARENPGKVIGGAAGVLVGASLLAYALSRSPKKRTTAAAPSRKRSTGSKKSSSSKKRTSKRRR